MPNWCNNVLTLKHENPELIERARAAAKNNTLFNTLVPIPTAFSGDFVSYDWALSNWGVKWDAEVTSVSEDDSESVSIDFDTPWGPPIEFYKKLEELGFEVCGHYFEPGMAFIGTYRDGVEDCHKIDTSNADVTVGLPSELVAIFDVQDWFEPVEDSEGDEA